MHLVAIDPGGQTGLAGFAKGGVLTHAGVITVPHHDFRSLFHVLDEWDPERVVVEDFVIGGYHLSSAQTDTCKQVGAILGWAETEVVL